METIINSVEASFKKTVKFKNRVKKSSKKKRIMKTIIKNIRKTIEIFSKNEDYYNGSNLIIQFQQKKNLIIFLKYKEASLFSKSAPAWGSASTTPSSAQAQGLSLAASYPVLQPQGSLSTVNRT